MSDDA